MTPTSTHPLQDIVIVIDSCWYYHTSGTRQWCVYVVTLAGVDVISSKVYVVTSAIMCPSSTSPPKIIKHRVFDFLYPSVQSLYI